MWDTLGNNSQHITNHSNKRDMAEVCELRERKNSIHYIRKPKFLPGGPEWMGSAWQGRGSSGSRESMCLHVCVLVCESWSENRVSRHWGRPGLAVLEGFCGRERKD